MPSNARHFVRAYGEWEREKARRLEHAGYAVTPAGGRRREQGVRQRDPRLAARRRRRLASARARRDKAGARADDGRTADGCPKLKPIHDGEDQPRLDDDRLPVVLVILDGLGDRPIPELEDRTPSRSRADARARPPDAARGLGLAHTLWMGSSAVVRNRTLGDVRLRRRAVSGRAVLEGIGAGWDLPVGVATTFASLRTSRVVDGRVWITRTCGQGTTCRMPGLAERVGAIPRNARRVEPVARPGRVLLQFRRFVSGHVTDSDPFFEYLHPWLSVRATDPAVTVLPQR